MKIPISSNSSPEKACVGARGDAVDAVVRAHHTANIPILHAHLEGTQERLDHILFVVAIDEEVSGRVPGVDVVGSVVLAAGGDLERAGVEIVGGLEARHVLQAADRVSLNAAAEVMGVGKLVAPGTILLNLEPPPTSETPWSASDHQLYWGMPRRCTPVAPFPVCPTFSASAMLSTSRFARTAYGNDLSQNPNCAMFSPSFSNRCGSHMYLYVYSGAFGFEFELSPWETAAKIVTRRRKID
ncbi:hypothetical protein ACMD2_01200 [Ananas comosus]|uniref:Uncharacterized protein n=1 Tax=Ananas comosus TaxID=4615 RepID=A0A199UCU0_ANACO|nr:hypothetical protein ACMD2_01200 [Ananas comosus]